MASTNDLYRLVNNPPPTWGDVITETVTSIEMMLLRGSSVILAAFLIAAITSAVFVLVALPIARLRVHWMVLSGSGFVVAFIAVIAGQLTGVSREAAIGDIAPVLLTGLGALFAASIFQEKVNTALSGLIALTFATTFHLGVTMGADQRERASNPFLFGGSALPPVAQQDEPIPGVDCRFGDPGCPDPDV
jgi:hypothetical protein